MAQETQDDLIKTGFDTGLSSYSEIEPGLFLGSLAAATNLKWLRRTQITHILTMDSCPLPRQIQECFPNITLKYIQITDMPKEDLLTHLDDTYEFIDHSLKSNGKILVHCYFGVSRSASVVIAYIMKKYERSYTDAFRTVKDRRWFIKPNPGFLTQLKLYEDMGFAVDNTNIKFKVYRLQNAADKVRKVKILPQDCIDLIKPDPAQTTVRPEPTVYRCKKCRRIVASASNILPHVPQGQILQHVSTKKQSKVSHEPVEHANQEEQSPTEFCTKIYFVEPMAWMPNIMQNVEGKLNCPKCNMKLGCFSWISGSQCPCGSKIAPAFYLVPSKVDWSNAVQNVQVTV